MSTPKSLGPADSIALELERRPPTMARPGQNENEAEPCMICGEQPCSALQAPTITIADLYRFIDSCTIGNSHGEHGVPERIHLDRLANVINKFFAK